MKEKKSNLFKYIMIVIVTAFITCILTTFVISQFCSPKLTQNSYKSFFGKFVGNIVLSMPDVVEDEENATINDRLYEIQQRLDQLYIGEYDKEKMIDGALEGYVAAVGDEYTEYLDESEIQDLETDINGSYVGVGLYIAQNTNTNEILVIGVIEDSPASKAGITAGDVVKKIDGDEYNGTQLTQASNRMKGIAGTKVKLTVEREDEEINFDVVRAEIKFKCVKSEMLENNIGYIKISSFGGGVASEFKSAYENIKSKSAKAMIIDLRNNGGGLVDQSLDIAEMIVPKGSKMLITADKNGNEVVQKSEKDPTIDIPIVILVNEYTASASEILTAAIRENTNVKVVGTNTYGKGVIQGVYLLKDRKTGLKITIQEYYTPNHNKINKIGIKPDEIIDLPEELKGRSNIDREKDVQLNKAIEILK